MPDTTLEETFDQATKDLIAKKLALGEYVSNPAAPYVEGKLDTVVPAHHFKLHLPFHKQPETATKAPKICIQAGHVNIQYNSIVALRGGTGAPGEAQFTQKVRDLVSTELRKRGFIVQGTDANANDDPNITGQDWDYFLALHYDSDVYGQGGGLMCAPAADDDAVNPTSVAIKNAFIPQYFQTTGVADHQERENGNTLYYYMWQYLTSNTPCGLIECGVGQHHPDDYDVLQNHQDKVVEGIVRSLCKYFNMPYDLGPVFKPMPQDVAGCQALLKKVIDESFSNDSDSQKVLKIKALFTA